tara:strand:- start:398 stop:1573 length:1176 start_codon:yes stop_codon:yes gene_type:complete
LTYLEKVKKKNKFLSKLQKLLKKNNYKIILFNKSLLCANVISLLSNDSYDDALLDISILQNQKLLKKINLFYKMKIKKDRIIIFYKNFSLNIFLINFKSTYSIFNGLQIRTNLLTKIKRIEILKNFYFIPKDDEEVIKKIFFLNKKEMLALSLSHQNTFSKYKNFFICFFYIFFFSKYYSNYELNFRIAKLYDLSFLQLIRLTLNKFKRKKIFKLSLNQFVKMRFDSNDFNYYLRKSHYDLITNNNKFLKIIDILNFFKKKKIKDIEKKIIETDTESLFDEPIYLNKKFWKTGNNFYIYPLIFGFKKNIIGYEKVNNYIKGKKKPKVYSKNYYKKLINMNNREIKDLMIKNPIAINKNGFLGGRHRVAAMIGRLINDEEYVPFYVYKEITH